MEKESKTHWKKNFNYNYLGSYSLNEGQEVTLTIEKINLEMVQSPNGGKDECTVVHFKEDVNGERKPMILNKTNCKIIEDLYNTPYIEEWKGKKITLFVDPNIKAFGETVEALRIKPIKPVINKPKLTPKSPRWNDAKKAVQSGGATLESISKHYSITESDFKLLKDAE